MEENPAIKNPEDVKRIFEIIRKELYEMMGTDPITNNDVSFWLYLLPSSLDTGSFDAINNFRVIFEGACSLTEHKELSVSVIELVVDEGNNKRRHSYIITPFKFNGDFSSKKSAYYSYVFIGPATSGYNGTGPEIQRSIQKILEKNAPFVKHVVKKVSSVDSFEGLFYEIEPIVKTFFPTFEISLRGFNKYDGRFMI